MKVRKGGLAELEQRFLDGDARALRAVVRQATGPNTLDVPFQDVQLRATPNGTGGTRLQFTGYACVVESPYVMADWLGEYTEIVRAGAFAKTLAENPDVIFCLNHQWSGAPMARTKAGTLVLEEDSTGLLTVAQLDGARSDVYHVQSAMDAGELDAMSFAFWVTRQLWSPDYEQRDIIELGMDGGDTSVVTWPANPATTGTTDLRQRALREQQARSLMRTRIPALVVQRAREEKRAGKTLSAATTETLQSVLDLIADSDIGLDSAQELLSELLGVDTTNDDTDTTSDDVDDDSTSAGEDEAKAGPHPADVRARLALAAQAGRK